MKTLAHDFLDIERECGFEVDQEHCYTLDALLNAAKEIDTNQRPEDILSDIAELLERCRFKYKVNGLFSHGLKLREVDGEEARWIDCKHYSLLYHWV